MTSLLAKDVRNVEDSFYDLLRRAPGTIEDKQAFFSAKMKVLVPKTSYDVMWERLVERLGPAGAGEALFDYVLANSYPRLRQLLEEAALGQAVEIYDSDRWVVWILFFGNGNPRRIGELLVDYIGREALDFPRRRRPGEPEAKRRVGQFEYDVALSFAGEQRAYVDEVAEALVGMGVKVFYDRFETVNLWGRDLPSYLDGIYREKAQFCVIFLSEDYVGKAWPRHEGESALARELEERGEYILPVRFDKADLPGLRPTKGYLEAGQYRPKRLARMIKKKLDRLA